MTRNHEQFVRYFIKYRDAKKAYKKIYPTANKESTRTGAARLMAREDVQAAIEKLKGPRHEKEVAELQEIVKEQMKLDIVDNLHRRHLCAQIMLGKQKVPRHFKFKDHTETIYDDPSPAAMLRAIELDAKLEYGWHNRAARQTSGRKDGRDDEPLYPGGVEIFIGGKDYDENRQSLLRSLWELDNPDKIKVDTRKNEEGMEISFVEYLVTPPWQNDPQWFDKQAPTPKATDSNLLSKGLPEGDLDNTNQIPPNRGNLQNQRHRGFVAERSNDPIQPAEPKAPALQHPENDDATINTNYTSPLKGDLDPQKNSNDLGSGVKKPSPAEQGYTPLGRVWEELYNTYLRNQHSNNYRAYRAIEILRDARHLPKAELVKIEQQTGWECHPQNRAYIRKLPYPRTT